MGVAYDSRAQLIGLLVHARLPAQPRRACTKMSGLLSGMVESVPQLLTKSVPNSREAPQPPGSALLHAARYVTHWCPSRRPHHALNTRALPSLGFLERTFIGTAERLHHQPRG